MSQQMYTVLLYIIYGTLGVSSIGMIFMCAFLMRSKGNGLSAISNNNLSLFENVKSYGVEKRMQKVCFVLTTLVFISVIAYSIVLKVGIQ